MSELYIHKYKLVLKKDNIAFMIYINTAELIVPLFFVPVCFIFVITELYYAVSHYIQ